MANRQRAETLSQLSMRTQTSCLGVLWILFIALFHVAKANKQAFIQSDTILEVLHFGEGSLLETESDLDFSSYHQKSSSFHRGNFRPMRFEPPMLDFHEQPVGMPKLEKVYLHNPSSEETIVLLSISAATAHFHASFFESRIIPPGGNTSFDVVFLARVVGNVENTLFINTSHHGVFTYQVFGVGIPNPYRLRPFIGARVPVNSSFSPLINIHNPHSEPLQVVEMYASGGDLHLELPTGQQEGTKQLWEIPPFETKGVVRASFSSRDPDNHTAFIRIKTNGSSEEEYIILPVEVEVTPAPGIYSSIEMLDFGTLRSQDRPKQLNLHLLNSGIKDVQITSVRPTPSNEAVTINFNKSVTLKAGGKKYTKVATISFDASKTRRPTQFSGKITVKAKEKSYPKLEIPYQADVLEGYLGFDHTATLFYIRDSPTDPVERPILLTNTFNFAIRIHNVSLPEDAKVMFKIQNFSRPVQIPPHKSRYVFSLLFRPVRPSTHIDSNILLITNASKFHLPIWAYTGFLEPLVLPPSPEEQLLDFSVLSASDVGSITFAIINSNPIELEIKSWQVTGDGLSVELLKSERGNRTTVLARKRELQNAPANDQKTVILASGYYATFRVTLVARDLQGKHEGAVHISTDYEILTIPVKAVIAVGTLVSTPKHIVLPASFPGKVVHQALSVLSSFTQKVKLLQVRSLTDDPRFYPKRLRSSKDELEPKRKSKVANIYFDASSQCGDHCYVGLPFQMKSEAKSTAFVMQEDKWDSDVDFHQTLLKRWKEMKENLGHELEAVFEVNTDLQKNVQTRVTAQLTWPSLINSSRHIRFPLTNTKSSSEEAVVLENPADVPVYVQILPLAVYPNPSAVAEKLLNRFALGTSSKISANTLEFQIHRNQTVIKSARGFSEGLSSHPFVYNLLLLPGEAKSFTVKFTPVSNHTVSSLLIVRNNLTVVDCVLAEGQGTSESLRVAGKPPGPGSSLRFKMTEPLLKDCSEKGKSKEPNFTLRKTFKVENTGQLPISVQSIEISGYVCEGYGFKVLNCQEFALKPNTSKEIVILFTPDFTTSRVIRELRLLTAGGSAFIFILNASLPYHMLGVCAEALPRPNWELELYITISLIMSSMFLLVIATAYLEAQGIWEPFKRRLGFEPSNAHLDTGRPFDLREIVRIQTEANLNEYSEPNHSSARGMYSSGSSSARGGGSRQGGPHPHPSGNHRASAEPDGLRSKIGGGRPPTQPGTRAGGGGPSSEGGGRKARGARQTQSQNQASGLVEQQTPVPTVPQQPQKGHRPEGGTRHSSEDSDYSSLIETMDKDLERPATPPTEVFQEPEEPLPTHSKATAAKGKVQRKSKAQRKREEKERRAKGKPQGEEPRDAAMDNEDSSSTTTETSNPDVDLGLKEEPVKKKGRPLPLEKEREDTPAFSAKPSSKKLSSAKKESQAELKSSSLELPYVTLLENKQRKNFTSKSLGHAAPLSTGPKARSLQKQKASCGKLEDCRPPPLVQFLSGSLGQDLGHSSSSEGEKDSSPPEWDSVPLHKCHSSTDSLQQISLQTMNADPFLKRPISALSRACSPPPVSLGLVPRGSYSSVLNTSSEIRPQKVGGNKNKLIKSISLPGKNGTPTFAAVAAGYDKSPGGSGPVKGASSQAEALGRMNHPYTTLVKSSSSDGSGYWSPTENPNMDLNSQNSFSAFGPNNFNLSRVFRMAFPKSQDPQQSWPKLGPVSPSIWDAPRNDPLHSWPTASGSPTAPTAPILSNAGSLWSAPTPFSSSIWSTSMDSSLHSLTPPTTAPLSDLIGSSDNGCPVPAPPPAPQAEIRRTYDPWNMWRPTLSRRSSEPWPNHSNHNNQ
ncbi:transmembrane protein 131-like isoform X1 [Anguilla anguilla]|uniref:transmembrane protein 131-like isoform X1 n=2 Tax=Anguilla anguilla TaxID=7936 RepID=UPI0015AAC2A1|nr:transmembrane protein 131-like isoform X1 [Anguilla anguilla]